ncbi:tetratricopeptide repeat-containing sensor histidine kinase [Seonamhaeicola maritimus]|uniref:tetratricopeptide repeat-containing sensor histidine kinase n=1 Tax=Seonamhaeicola maritimus TaxID=2591822 RepID=UPI002494C068|nr:sensor histidine kinase [Seonamhaeicola maritimus]
MRNFLLLLILFFSCDIISQNDSVRVKELLDIAYGFEKTNMDSAVFTYKKAAKLGEKIEYWIGVGRATSYTGIVFSDYGLNDSAIVYHKRSIPFYKKANYTKGVASSLINLANAHLFRGDYEASTDYYFQGIEHYEKLKDTANLIYAYGNFASLFSDYKLFNKSKHYQSKALKFSYLINDTISIGYLLNDLGLTYLSLYKKDSAFMNFSKALNIAEKFDDEELKYYSNKNLNNYYFSQNNFNTAIDYAIKSYKNAIATKKPYYECYSLYAIGNAKLKLNQIDSAHYYIKKSIKIASKIQAKEHLMDGYYTLNQILFKQGNYKEAYDSFRLFNQYQDSVVGQKTKEYTTKLEQQYQVKNKDNEILLQQLEIEKNEAQIQKQINRNTLYIIGLLILAFLLFILWYRQRQKQKLHAQSIQTLNKQKELASLEALIEGENLERARIAKDLHDSVNGSLSAIKHNLSSIGQDNLKSADLPTFFNAINMLDMTCEQVRNISHNLVPPSLLNYGLLEALEQYCNRVSGSKIIQATFQHFGKFSTLPKKIEATIYHVIQELLNNSVKHAQASNAIVQINFNDENIHITVEDNGKGFNIKKVTHGLGLNNIKSRIEFLNAHMNLKSDSKGTSVTIDIDLNKIPRI